MKDINVAFTRIMLSGVMESVRKLTSAAERKASWVYHFGNGHWEFHGPKDMNGKQFYWHGRAYGAYDARTKGWGAWLDALEREGDAARARAEGEQLRREG